MEIKEYFLKDIIYKKPQYGYSGAALNKGSIKYLTQSDLDKQYNEINKFVNFDESNKKFLLNQNDFLMSRAGTIKSYFYNDNKPIIFAGYLVRYYFKQDILLNKYFYYWTKANYGKELINNISKTGTTMPKLNPPIFLKIKMKIPNINIQQEIINIIEPKEDLFLKYHSIIDISNLDAFKKSWYNLINIIEPFEKLSHIINRKINYLLTIGDLVLISSKSGKKIKIEDVCNVNIGSTPSTKIKDYWIGENEWLNSGILTNNLVVVKGSNFISSDAIKNKNLKESKYMNTFISIIEPSINKISLSSKSFYYNQSIANIEAKEEINKGFIFFKLRQVIKDLSLLSSGTAQKSVNKDKINNFFISISNENINLYNNLCFYFIKLHNQIEVINNLINKLINLYIF